MPLTKILFLAANPSDTARLRLPQEMREIQEGLDLSEGRDQFEVISKWAVRPDDLRRALLKHKPQIVHFSGHGKGEQGLIFESEADSVKLVDASTLFRLFKLCPSVQCVVLNACYSQVQAEAIAQHVQHVVGMNNSLGDRAAIQFAVGFYDGLGYGRPVEEAFEFGLLAIDLSGLPGSATPILKSRQQDVPDSEPDLPDLDLPDPESDSSQQETILWEEPEGLVPVGSPFYVERSPIERDCYEALLNPGSLIRIKAPRQMGKTSLLVRILDHARQQRWKEEHWKVVRLNLQTVENQTLTNLGEFLQWFCASVTEELDLPEPPANYWTDKRGYGSALSAIL